MTFLLNSSTSSLRLPPYHDCFMQPPLGTLVKNRAHIERLFAKLITLNYLPSDYPSYQNVVCKADLKVLESVIFDSRHVLCPIFPPSLLRPGLHKCFNPFDLPI